jgi:ABC-type multidrug transport system fused ATPase/permease subunit
VFILSLFTANECKQLAWYIIYLTNWNVILNAVSSVYSAVMVTLFYRKVIKVEFNESVNKSSNNNTQKLLKLQWILWTLSLVISISLSCVYWPLVYTGKDKGLNDSLTHAGNAIVNFIDLFVIACPARFGHFIYSLIFGLIYSFLFSMPYALLGGLNRHGHQYIYSVIDWKGNFQNAFCFAIAVLIFLSCVHLLLTLLAKLREKIYNRIENNRNLEKNSMQTFDNPSFNV